MGGVSQAGDSDWGSILLQEKIPWMLKPLISKVSNNVFKVVQCLLLKSVFFLIWGAKGYTVS